MRVPVEALEIVSPAPRAGHMCSVDSNKPPRAPRRFVRAIGGTISCKHLVGTGADDDSVDWFGESTMFNRRRGAWVTQPTPPSVPGGPQRTLRGSPLSLLIPKGGPSRGAEAESNWTWIRAREARSGLPRSHSLRREVG